MDWQGWFALSLAGVALILMSVGRFGPHLVMMGVLVVRKVRGGLLIGIVLTQPVAAALVAAAQQRGLIINATTDSRIRLAPPLTIGDAEIAEFAKKFAAALSDVQTPAGDTP